MKLKTPCTPHEWITHILRWAESQLAMLCPKASLDPSEFMRSLAILCAFEGYRFSSGDPVPIFGFVILYER